ncbi:hypothetical protein KMZ32_19725 [Phycicoccus sp. MAQZ13P-2]|uniref:hypothetical protein n=1 Tax=Phycicoccus mangrovi TaxID=2840470 RepID=UPI001C00295F|nr:hypothetical protein [Phycicoccus mangrovi]MBT9258096.1 hypothetical protein [Phycicoccus mangrovi]MBT9276307.1 hypothetical protein [Phycicoccus mangrovi]
MGELVGGPVPLLPAARRRAGRPAAAASLAVACALGGCSGSGEAVGTVTSPAPTVVSCPGGSVNSGVPDGVAGSDGVADVREHATRWADAAGFADRFPAARLVVVQSPGEAAARFVERDVLRAKLTYSRSSDARVLDALEYC